LHKSKANQGQGHNKPIEYKILLMELPIPILNQSKQRNDSNTQGSKHSSNQVNPCQVGRISNKSIPEQGAYPQGNINSGIKKTHIKVGHLKLFLDVELIESVAHSKHMKGGVGQRCQYEGLVGHAGVMGYWIIGEGLLGDYLGLLYCMDI